MKKVGEVCYLSELLIGQSAVVTRLLEQNKEIKRHLLDMGITEGTQITIKKIAPLGNPIDIELRGYDLVICTDTLKKIQVKII